MNYPNIKSPLMAAIVLLLAGLMSAALTGESWLAKTVVASDILADSGDISSIANQEAENETALVSSNTTRADIIMKKVIGNGGLAGAVSGGKLMGGTTGEACIGTSSSPGYVLYHGFWGPKGGVPPCDCVPGDPNNDLFINVGDAVYLINFVFKGGPAPTPYAVCSGDANADCLANVGDAVYLVNYVFKGGPVPATCEEWMANCGTLRD